MLDNTQQKGTATELHCILDLTNLGIRCLKPVDESSKYDVVADLNGKFIRIQCKTASWVTDTQKEKVLLLFILVVKQQIQKQLHVISIQKTILIIFILGLKVKVI